MSFIRYNVIYRYFNHDHHFISFQIKGASPLPYVSDVNIEAI